MSIRNGINDRKTNSTKHACDLEIKLARHIVKGSILVKYKDREELVARAK
jgi:hypothetical protein